MNNFLPLWSVSFSASPSNSQSCSLSSHPLPDRSRPEAVQGRPWLCWMVIQIRLEPGSRDRSAWPRLPQYIPIQPPGTSYAWLGSPDWTGILHKHLFLYTAATKHRSLLVCTNTNRFCCTASASSQFTWIVFQCYPGPLLERSDCSCGLCYSSTLRDKRVADPGREQRCFKHIPTPV